MKWIVCFVVLAGGAMAQDKTNEFSTRDSTGLVHAHLASDDIKEVQELVLHMYYSGYVQGVAELDLFTLCIPPGVKSEEIKKVVGQFMVTHPERQHLDVLSNVTDALAGAYGCKGK